VVLRAGGRIEKEANGEEVFVIPVPEVQPSPLELSWAPGPIANSRFTEAEMAQITVSAVPPAVIEAVEKVAPGWKAANCGLDMDPGLRAEFRGQQNVLVTHPLDQQTGCTLSRTVEVPADQKTALHLVVTHDPRGDWLLVVKADGKEILSKVVSQDTVRDGWLDLRVDLSEYAGKSVKLELINQPNGWAWEAGYWATIAVE
jgi:hypothetical protein